VKANYLSTTSTGSIGIVCACTWISANDVSCSSPIEDRRYVFSCLRVEKQCSGVAVVTGQVTSTCSRMDRFGYRDALHPVQSWVVPLQHASVASTAQTRLGACRDCRRWTSFPPPVAEHGIHTWLVSIAALQIGVPWPWSSTSCNDLSVSASVIKACSVFCFCTHAGTQGIIRWPTIQFEIIGQTLKVTKCIQSSQ